MISAALENQTPRRRSALLIAVFANAALALLVVASAASAGATGGLDPTSAAAATSVPVEQVSETAASSGIPVEHAPTPGAEAQPAETPETTSVTDSAHAIVTSVVDEPGAAAPGNPPISTSPGDAAGRSAAAIVDSASAGTTSVVPAGAGSAATIARAAKRHVAALGEDIRHDLEPTVEGIRQSLPGAVANVRQGVAEEISALTDRVLTGPAGTLLSPLLKPSNPVSAAVMLPSAGPLQTGGDFSKDGPLSSLEPLQASFFSSWNPIASGGYTGGHSALSEVSGVEEVGPASPRPSTLGKISSTATSGAGTSLDAATPDSRGPTPLHVPLPAPRSPEAIAPGSGGALFVPFAALLALLALVAPASMRRLREAPEFRAPIPFVCALERPG